MRRLNTIQRRALNFYKDHRERPLTGRRGALLLAPAVARYAIVAGIIIVALVQLGMHNAALWMSGLFAGAALREVRHVYNAVQNWPVFVSLLNWDRIDALLAEDAAASSEH
jgi:hypothetical protein